MPTYEFVTVDVFTDRRFGGNPLAVFPDARGLTDEQMQALALEFNLSETTFVLPPDNPQHHAKVRIFTPRAELPFAGHPNVGTGYVLARRDDKPPEHYVFEELAGLVRVHVLRFGSHDCGGAHFGAACAIHRHRDSSGSRRSLRGSGGIGYRYKRTYAAGRLGGDAIRHCRSCERGGAVARQSGYRCVPRGGRKVSRGRDAVFAAALCAAGWRCDAADCAYVRAVGGHSGGSGDRQRQRGTRRAADVAGAGRECRPGLRDLQGAEMGRPSTIIASARKTAEGPVLATVEGSCVPVLRGTVEL